MKLKEKEDWKWKYIRIQALEAKESKQCQSTHRHPLQWKKGGCHKFAELIYKNKIIVLYFSLCGPFDGSGMFDVEPEEIENLQIDNFLLKNELEDVKQAHEKGTKVFAAKFKSALRKLKLDQKMSNKMRTEFEKQIDDNENLKIQLNEKDTELKSLRKEYQDLKLELEKSLSLHQNENDESKRVSNRRQNYNVRNTLRYVYIDFVACIFSGGTNVSK